MKPPSAGPFYLEISGRQTGKTTRLIAAVRDHIKTGHAIIYVMNFRQAQRIEAELKRDPGMDAIGGRVHFIMGDPTDAPSFKVENPQRFFDEWDHIPNCPYDENGYYCSTLKKLRETKECQGDSLFGLLWRKAGGQPNRNTADFERLLRYSNGRRDLAMIDSGAVFYEDSTAAEACRRQEDGSRIALAIGREVSKVIVCGDSPRAIIMRESERTTLFDFLKSCGPVVRARCGSSGDPRWEFLGFPVLTVKWTLPECGFLIATE